MLDRVTETVSPRVALTVDPSLASVSGIDPDGPFTVLGGAAVVAVAPGRTVVADPAVVGGTPVEEVGEPAAAVVDDDAGAVEVAVVLTPAPATVGESDEPLPHPASANATKSDTPTPAARQVLLDTVHPTVLAFRGGGRGVR